MKKTLVLSLCALLIGVVGTWAVIKVIIPQWNRSALNNTYWEVTAKLDQGGEAFGYLHTEMITAAFQRLLSNLEKNLTTAGVGGQDKMAQAFNVLNMVFKGYGLEEISGLGYSSITLKPGLHRNRVVIYHRPGRDQGLLWNIAGPAPRYLDEMDMLPAETALAGVSDYNLAKLIEWASQVGPKMAGLGGQGPTSDQAMAMIKGGLKSLGVDYDRLFKSYGGRLGFLLTLDPEKRVSLPLAAKPLSIPEPAFAILIRVNDYYLFDTIKNKLGVAGKPKISEAGGVKRIAFPPLPAPFLLEPVIAQKGEWLLAASRASIVDAIFSGNAPRLASSDAFKEMAYKMPRRGNGFGYVSPMVPLLVAQIIRENKTVFPVPAASEKIAAILTRSKGLCHVWENSATGLVYTINHGIEISTLGELVEAFIEIAKEKSLLRAAVEPAPPPVGDEVGK